MGYTLANNWEDGRHAVAVEECVARWGVPGAAHPARRMWAGRVERVPTHTGSTAAPPSNGDAASAWLSRLVGTAGGPRTTPKGVRLRLRLAPGVPEGAL